MSVFFRNNAFVDETSKTILAYQQPLHSVHALNTDLGTAATLILWTIIEPSIYIIAACLPSLRVLVSRSSIWASALLSTFGKTDGRSNKDEHQLGILDKQNNCNGVEDDGGRSAGRSESSIAKTENEDRRHNQQSAAPGWNRTLNGKGINVRRDYSVKFEEENHV